MMKKLKLEPHVFRNVNTSADNDQYLYKYFSSLDDINRDERIQGKIGGPWGKHGPSFVQ